jgi:hypothetical protein
MCGSDTLTTVVSSTSMKVLDMTAMAISHGLMSRAISGLSAIWQLAVRIWQLAIDHDANC